MVAVWNVRWPTLLALSLAVACATGSTSDGIDGGGPNGTDADPSAPDAEPPPPDASPPADAPPVGGDCDPVLQTGCHVTQKCAWLYTDLSTGEGRPGCWPNGTTSVGDSCDRPDEIDTGDDCVKGSHCIFATCKEICRLDDPPVSCSSGGCVGVEDLGFDICLATCDPLLQNCPLGEGCYLVGDGPVCADVIGAGVPPGGSCESANSCQAGAGCFDDGAGGGICYAYCDYATYPNLNDPTHCQPGESCTGITGEDLYGVCTS